MFTDSNNHPGMRMTLNKKSWKSCQKIWKHPKKKENAYILKKQGFLLFLKILMSATSFYDMNFCRGRAPDCVLTPKASPSLFFWKRVGASIENFWILIPTSIQLALYQIFMHHKTIRTECRSGFGEGGASGMHPFFSGNRGASLFLKC